MHTLLKPLLVREELLRRKIHVYRQMAVMKVFRMLRVRDSSGPQLFSAILEVW